MTAAGVSFRDARGPDGTVVYAIGDVHGRLDLLGELHARITFDLKQRGARDWRIVHLGDYVDRGPDSRGVIDFLADARERDDRNVMLAGNHDVGMLAFLAEPDAAGLFVRYGGEATARSYGVRLEPDRIETSHRALVRAVPERHLNFLQTLTFSTALGDFFFCHAGIRPGLALDAQQPDVLIWIRDDFLRFTGLHPKVVVHGHTPTRDPELPGNRVNIDTGAYFSGRLTALAIAGAEKRILSVEGAPG